jgi:hypothetical protein
VRSGDVSAFSDWPRDRPELVVAALGLAKSERDAFDRLVKGMDSRKVILSSVGISPGDSGGPLVDKEGRLIGVTFAVPTEPGAGRAPLALHVHLDEVRKFLPAKYPDGPPEPFVPDVLPSGLHYELASLGRSGAPDALLFGQRAVVDGRERKAISGILLDLKQSNGGLKPDDLADPAKRKAWKAQFVLHAEPYNIAFYDTQDAGRFDLILLAPRGKADAEVVLKYDAEAKRWRPEAGRGRALINAAHFAKEELQDKFVPFANAFQTLVRKAPEGPQGER